jgi:hypothetical protein
MNPRIEASANFSIFLHTVSGSLTEHKLSDIDMAAQRARRKRGGIRCHEVYIRLHLMLRFEYTYITCSRYTSISLGSLTMYGDEDLEMRMGHPE